MYLGAHVLVPEGFDTHPEARYPLMIDHGHFPYTFGGFREEPPDPNLKPDFSARFNMSGYNRYQQQAAYDFYKEWTGPGFPRVLVIQIQHPTPFYDDSYAVNSANAGPWGDAIVEELIPYIEKKYRGIGQGWARFMYGGSTGGWEALAAQVFYPDAFNGAYAACPDPIDFRAYTVVNLYEDTQRLLPRQRVEEDTPTRACATGSDTSARRSRRSTCANSRSARRRARASSGTSGRRPTRRSAPTATRSASGTRSPAPSTRTSPRTGATTTTSCTS